MQATIRVETSLRFGFEENKQFKPNPNKGTKIAACVNKIKTKTLHQLIC